MLRNRLFVGKKSKHGVLAIKLCSRLKIFSSKSKKENERMFSFQKKFSSKSSSGLVQCIFDHLTKNIRQKVESFFVQNPRKRKNIPHIVCLDTLNAILTPDIKVSHNYDIVCQ